MIVMPESVPSATDPDRRWVIATGNAHKYQEFCLLAQEVPGLELLPLPPEVAAEASPEETEDSYEGNARVKAVYYASRLGVSVLSDDSGLEIPALEGFPGIISARFASEVGGYPEAFAVLREKLRDRGLVDVAGYPTGLPVAATFVCAMASKDNRGCVWSTEARWHGHLALDPDSVARTGFGYDPIFVPQGYRCPVACLDASVKQAQSHRRRAWDRWVAALTVSFASSSSV
jgi:XTP/dITP diphosphohydrolase